MSNPPYYRPASIVQQEFALIPSGVIADQPPCIIGPNFRVFNLDDSGDKALMSLGAYDPDADADFDYPSRPLASTVDQTSVKLRFEDLLAKYATLSGTGVIQRGDKANRIKIPTANAFQAYINTAGTSFSRNSLFKLRDVAIGDRVKIVANSKTLETRITGFINEVIASSTASPTATTNLATRSYSGAAADTEVMGTDHASAIETGSSTYLGNPKTGKMNDVYVLECTKAGVAGTQQVETATVVAASGITGDGNITVVVTGADFTGSPITLSVAATTAANSASAVATLIRAAIGANTVIAALYTVGGSGADITLTRILPAANDTTLNISIANGTCTGITTAATSANTTAGAVGTAEFKVTSDNGDNVALLTFENVAFDTPFAVGSLGLYASIGGSDAFIVGEQFTFTMVAAYTRSAPTLTSSSSDYTGLFDAVYKIKVVKGGTWDQFPQVVVTTNNGIDSASAQVIDYNVSFAVGNNGITVKFADDLSAAQDGLVYGDEYFIEATASQKGAVRTATLAAPIDSSIVEDDDLAVDFYIYKKSFDLEQRGYPDFSSVTVTPGADSFTVSAGIQIQDSTWLETDGVTLANLDVVKATMYVGYRTLLTTAAGVVSSISDLSSVEAVLGSITIDNPLGLCVYKALENAAGSSVFFVPVGTNDLAGYTLALRALERDERVYFRVPATNDEAIKDLVAAHVNAQSEKTKGHECMGIVGTDFDPIKTLYGTKTGGENWTGYVEQEEGSDPAVYTIGTIPGATLLTDGVRAGDEVRSLFGVDALGNDIYESAIIQEVVDEENFILVSPGFSEAVGSSSSLQRVQVVRALTLDEQAQVMKEISEAFANRRVANVVQEIGSEYPAYVMAAAVAGLAGSVVPHQPLTNYTVNGFNDQSGSLIGFTPDQLDLIASGGTLVVVKATVDGQVYIRHQLTTDRSDDRKAEMSFTRNYDSISRFLRDGFSPFQGKYNIGPHYFQLLDVSLRQRLDLLAATIVTQSAGPQLVSWDPKSLSISQNAVTRTKTDASVSVTLPLPNNVTELVITASA